MSDRSADFEAAPLHGFSVGCGGAISCRGGCALIIPRDSKYPIIRYLGVLGTTNNGTGFGEVF